MTTWQYTANETSDIFPEVISDQAVLPGGVSIVSDCNQANDIVQQNHTVSDSPSIVYPANPPVNYYSIGIPFDDSTYPESYGNPVWEFTNINSFEWNDQKLRFHLFFKTGFDRFSRIKFKVGTSSDKYFEFDDVNVGGAVWQVIDLLKDDGDEVGVDVEIDYTITYISIEVKGSSGTWESDGFGFNAIELIPYSLPNFDLTLYDDSDTFVQKIEDYGYPGVSQLTNLTYLNDIPSIGQGWMKSSDEVSSDFLASRHPGEVAGRWHLTTNDGEGNLHYTIHDVVDEIVGSSYTEGEIPLGFNETADELAAAFTVTSGELSASFGGDLGFWNTQGVSSEFGTYEALTWESWE